MTAMMKLGIDVDRFHKVFTDADRDVCMRWLEALGVSVDDKVTALWILDESGCKVAIRRFVLPLTRVGDHMEMTVGTVESECPIPLRLLAPIEDES